MGAGANPLFDAVFTAERTNGVSNAAVASGSSVAIKAGGPGFLCRVIVNTLGTGVATFYDNPSAASGTVIFIVPASAVAGTIYQVIMPVLTGIFCVSAASGPVLAVSYL
jgi:hypothetical protein